MQYHFRVGRGKKLLIDENDTFMTLGFMILDEYGITPNHLFLFEFADGERTNSACPFGPMHDDLGNISIESKIKDMHLSVGDEMRFVYDFSRDWTRKVKLIEVQ